MPGGDLIPFDTAMGSIEQPHAPVIIVGAGPVGLTTATNIAKQGIKVLVLERWDKVDQSPRAASYQPCAQAELMETGTYDDVRKHSIVNDVSLISSMSIPCQKPWYELLTSTGSDLLGGWGEESIRSEIGGRFHFPFRNQLPTTPASRDIA